MSNKKIEKYNEVYDVNDNEEEILTVDKDVIELSELPQQVEDNKKYNMLNETIKRATNPDELIFRSDVSLRDFEVLKKVRDDQRNRIYQMWSLLIDKGRKIHEDVIRMLQNYIISECNSDNLENVERCRKYREILEQYWNKNPSLREIQQRIDGGKRIRRAKKYTMKSNKRKSTKKSNKKRYRATKRYKKHKR
jgi:hypothetical protein